MRNFAGFKRRAVVIVPTDEDFNKRIEKRTSEEGKDVPDSAVLEMKGTYVGPVPAAAHGKSALLAAPARRSRVSRVSVRL